MALDTRASVHGRPGAAGNRARLDLIGRHVESQRRGLLQARRILEGWVFEGLGRLDAEAMTGEVLRIEALEACHLPEVTRRMRSLLQGLQVPVETVEAREARLAQDLAGLWLLIRRGLEWAEGWEKLADAGCPNGLSGGTAALQTALGRRWTARELRSLTGERDLTLVELLERRSEAGRRARVMTRLLFDLQSRRWMQSQGIPDPSRVDARAPTSMILEVWGAQLWPTQEGAPDDALPRVRWSPKSVRQRHATDEDWIRLVAAAQPLARVLARHELLTSRPWHEPVSHPELLQLQAIERAGEQWWMRDPSGERYRLRGPPEALATLECLGLPRDCGALAVRVLAGPSSQAPSFEPFALLTRRGPVRLV